MIRLEKNDARMVKWMCNVRCEDKISPTELKTGLQLNSMKKCLHDRRLQWSYYVEKMKKSTWSSKSRTYKTRGSLPKERTRET